MNTKNFPIDLPPDIRQLLEAAILAPSGHNTQPWYFSINDHHIQIEPDFTRRLPVVDPIDRELWTSLGCALENIIRKARTLGYHPSVDLSRIQHATKPGIKINLEPAASRPDPLVNAIPLRRTNRRVYHRKAIPPEVLEQLGPLTTRPDGVNVYMLTDPKVRGQLVTLVQAGNRRQMADRAFTEELYNWMRVNRHQVRENQDGLTFEALDFPALPGFVANWFVRGSLKPEVQVKRDQEKLESTPAFALITVSADDAMYWVAAGQVLQTLALQATYLNVAHAYCNQPVEVPELRPDLLKAARVTGEVPLLLLRLGYAASTPITPRRPLQAVLRT